MMDPDLLRQSGAQAPVMTKVLPADTGPLVRATWACPLCGLERQGGPPATCGSDNPDCPIG